MKPLLCTVVLCLFSTTVSAQTIVYEQPHNLGSGLYHSSWWDPNGSDYDQYVWDGFTLSSAAAITEVRWRGGFDPAYFGSGGPVVGFTVEIWSSIAGGSQPDIASYYTPNPLRHYVVAGNAGQTLAGTFGGVPMYDYHFTLPAAFQAAAGTKYWVQIEAWQHGIPDWSIAIGTGGDGGYFRRIANVGDIFYQAVPGDAAFSLLTMAGPTHTVAAVASPANGGTIAGAGVYPAGAAVSLAATANAGFGFVNWTENGVQVSASSTYNFTLNVDRSLVANFAPAFLVTTIPSPSNGGSTTGDGYYTGGSTVTVTATPGPGYLFVDWMEFGTTVSTSATYSFAADADHTLIAEFMPDPSIVLFDFDNAPLHASLPIDLTVSGLTAHLSATGQGFSIQQANTMGFTPAGFGGFCVYPNSIYASDLLISFSATLTDFSIMYAPQELGCDDSARMRVTAYMGTTNVGTRTTTAPVPGTWPTGTLSISVPGGFNRVVVHYDARPPTCQDYGTIFLADNMLVTQACAGAAISQQPLSDSTCSIGGSSFLVSATGSIPLQYFWQAELDPGIWTDLAEGNLTHNGIVLCAVYGATTDWMQMYALTGFLLDRPTLNVRCFVSNACGGVISDVASLTVWPTGTGDANGDGVVDGADVQPFISYILDGWTQTPGWCACDLDMDGWVDETEIPMLVGLLLGP